MDPEELEDVNLDDLVEEETLEDEIEDDAEPEQEPEADEVDDEAQEVEEEDTEAETTDDDFSVSFGDEEEKEEAPEWVKNIRKSNRELAKKNRELERKLEERAEAEKVTELGEKPRLDQFDYDEVKYSDALSDWMERKREVDANAKAQEEEQAKLQEEWQAKLDSYADAKAVLVKKAKDYEDAEDEVREVFSPARQGILLDAVKDPALMVYALGKNPKRARELAEIKNDVRFVAELARLEQDMKVTGIKNRKAPEKRVGMKGGNPTSTKTSLARLEAEAERTGDYTKLFKAQKRMREHEKAK